VLERPPSHAHRQRRWRGILKVTDPIHRRHYSMPQPRRRRHGPQPDRRRALELLASCHDGCIEAMVIAHGFNIEQLVELVHAGLAIATAECMVAGNRTMEVATLRITEAGRRVLG